MRTPRLAGILCAAALVAGCGGGGGGGGGGKTSTGNGEASKPAATVLADAKDAASSASSFHISGHGTSGATSIALDVSIGKQDATGSIATSGLSFQFVRIGETLYIKGSDAFYKHYAGAAAAQLLKGKWLKGSAKSGQLAQLDQFASAGAIFALIASNNGKLVNKGVTTYKGQSVVAIVDTTKGGTLYVAVTGKPYPVAIVPSGAGKDTGALAFSDWNATVSVSAPKGAIDISALGAG